MLRQIYLVAFAVIFLAKAVCADEFFTEKVEPILKSRCFECHSHGHSIEGGLALDSKSGWVKGGKSGPAVVPQKPETSLLIKAISHVEVDLKMPPDKRLPVAEIAVLTEWVKRGAVDPRSMTPTSGDTVTKDEWESEFQRRLDWWSLKPVTKVTPPLIEDARWSREPVDRFIRQRLEQAKLNPAAPASDDVLKRRLSFVLTGLPLHGNTNGSVEEFVDRCLQSPHFGERFARHWMDVVRYTDTYGYEWDNPAKGSHEYRDYLIRAFNDDLGFDQLLREQLAGDLLPQPRVHPATATLENLIAPMFYHFGEHRHGSSLQFNGVHQEMVNNKIDALSKSFLALTVACARCHDHKLEAVAQRDYYALAAMLTTPHWTARAVDAPSKHATQIEKLKQLRSEIRMELAKRWEAVTITPEALKASLGDLSKAKAVLGDVAYPLLKLAQREADAPTAWTELQTEWRTTREQRLKANAAFNIYDQFDAAELARGRAVPIHGRGNLKLGDAPAFAVDGDGFIHGQVEDGTPLIALTGDAVLSQFLPRGLHSHALSSKLPGSLRTPPQRRIGGQVLSVKLAGAEYAGYLVMDDHTFQNETVSFLKDHDAKWKSFGDATLINGVQQVTIDFATASLNPNFPPRTGLAAGLLNSDFGYDKRSWLSITGLAQHDAGGTPQDVLDLYQSLFERTAPASAADAWTQASNWLTQAIRRWQQQQVQAGDRKLLDWMLESKLLPNQAAPNTALAKLVEDYRRIEASIEFPRTAISMDERETQRAVYPLNVRGNVDVLGPALSPDFLKMFENRHGVASSPRSGRLELAEFLLHPEHPLTARVYVNRVWQWIFGTGLVATPDDFGRLGDRPSHPELLDWLAQEFIRDGWSTKRLIRRLVLSETFRQSGVATMTARDVDPQNRLLSYFPTRRLEAEAIRDALLVVSGRWDARLYGRPILPHRLAEDGSKRLYSGPVDGHGRRSLYLQMSIMEPPKFLVSFNLPDLKLPSGRRDVTNVPAQALVLLNDPFVIAMSKHWAGVLVKEQQTTPRERLQSMLVRAFGRVPTEGESDRWLAALSTFATKPVPTPMDLLQDEPAWQQLAHALFNAKEFLYYR